MFATRVDAVVIVVVIIVIVAVVAVVGLNVIGQSEHAVGAKKFVIIEAVEYDFIIVVEAAQGEVGIVLPTNNLVIIFNLTDSVHDTPDLLGFSFQVPGTTFLILHHDIFLLYPTRRA